MMSVTLTPGVRAIDHRAGSDDATVTLVEYGDYQCPHCLRAYPVTQALEREFGPALRFVFRHFPLAEIHEYAVGAAEAAESVNAALGAEGFWNMHRAIFGHQQDSGDALAPRLLARYAASVGADEAMVARDLKNATHRARVKSDFMSGVRSGVNGTPTFFLNGVRYDGDWSDAPRFASAIRGVLTTRE